ncbi:MAG: protein kinase domain-containing protein, partial [Blastocatellia bacterium]
EDPTLVLSPDRPVAPSPRHPVRTDPGALMGTANYMSPEQARGLDVDHRSDLFSLGIVLYEMLAGKTPFAGESPTAVRAAIFAQEPPPLAPAETPKELQRIVNRALCKDPERRYQSARELLDDLKRLQRETERQTNLDRSLALALAAVIISILAGSIGVWSFFKSRRQPPPQNGQISATRLTAAGAVNDVAVSPDGRYVAYTIGHYADRSLWAREMATGGEAQLLPAGAGYVYQSLAFTPVGDEIYYVAYERAGDVNALYRIPARGGTPRRVLERIDSPAAFAPDGQRFAFVRYDREFGQSEIVITNTDGGGERTLIARRDPVKLSTRRIAWSHDGRSIAYAAGTHSNERDHYVYEALVADGTERLLSPQPWRAIKGVAWLGGRGGLALLATDPVNDMFLIWGLSLPGGERRKLSTELGDPSDLSVTADGETIITAHAEEKQSVWVAPSAGLSRIRQLTPALEEAGRAGLTWTYDGRILYVTRSGGRPSIRVMDADGGNDRQFSSGNDDAPSVTPDGRHIVFCSTTDGPHIWRMDGDGSNRRRLTFGKREVEPRCTPDGRWVVYVSLEGNQRILWRAPIDGGVPIQLTDVTTATPHPAVSPDGKWLAYYHRDPRETERKRILIIPTSGGPPVKTLDVPHTAYLLQWSPGGRAIDYADAREGSTELWRTPLDGGRPRRLTSFELHSVSRFAWSRDGSRLVVSLVTHSRDVVLIRDF